MTALAPRSGLLVFVATRTEDVPHGCAKYLSVDGSVPGAALTWDHHVTGEAINLDAMPDLIDSAGYDGIGTTLADLDAVASVIAVNFGGKANLPAGVRAVLECGSHWCDHLRPHPNFDAEQNRLGRGLLDAVAPLLGGGARETSARFAEQCADLTRTIGEGAALPYADLFEGALARARTLGRLGRIVQKGDVALVDLRGEPGIDPAALYLQFPQPVAVFIDTHSDGGRRYTVGVNPHVPVRPTDLREALQALAEREFVHGPPCLGPKPQAGQENWGGRATVFGSPFNYGSRLAPEEVVEVVTDGLRRRA